MKKLVLTGGGSAGHVVPNIALFPRLREYFELYYIGTDGIERRLLYGKEVPFYTIAAPKLVRGALLPNLSLPLRFLSGMRQAKRALREIAPSAVFSKGGYVALPVVFAAASLNIPVLSHESDLSAGLANRLIARKCKTVLTSFPETAQGLKNGKYSGSPVREELFLADRAAALAKYGFSGRKPVLLSFGGGSGSQTINRALEGALPRLLPQFDILHLRGKEEGAPRQPGYLPLAYEQDMASAYACADVVLARAGSNTVFEILALKKPALFVPLENRRSRGDQVENASYFQEKGLCRVLRERDLTPAALARELSALSEDADLRRSLSSCKFVGGNQTIVREILSLCGI